MSNRERFTSYVSGGRKTVEGWCYRDAYAILEMIDGWQQSKGVHGTVGELGVYKGAYFIAAALLARPDEKILAIDIFGEAAATEASAPETPDYGNPKDEFLENVRQHAGPEIIERTDVVTADSVTLGSDDVLGFAGGPIRLLSLDGSHTAPAVEHDLRLLAPTLAPGGALILDDVYNPYTPGVAEGVNRAMAVGERPDLAPVLIATDANKVVMMTAGEAGECRAAIQPLLEKQGRNVTTRTFLGHPTLVVPAAERPRGPIRKLGRQIKRMVRGK